MARPAVAAEDRLTALLRARCTDAEKTAILARAAANGLTESEYVRRAALRGKIVVQQNRAPDLVTAVQLKRIGNNLNQLVSAYHVGGERPPEELRQVYADLQRIFDLILAAD